MKRPFGIAVLAVIHFLEAFLFVFTGAVLWLFARLVAELGTQALEAPDEMSARMLPLILEFIQSGKLVAVFVLIGALALVFAIAGVGLWRLRRWARGLTVGLMALRLVLLLPGLVVFAVVQFDAVLLSAHVGMALLYAWIVWYLFQPEVKRAFGVA